MKNIKTEYEKMQEWKHVDNGRTLDKHGGIVQGGLFDKEIFGNYSDMAMTFDGDADKLPSDFSVKMGIIRLNYPVNFVGNVDNIDATLWYRASAIAVLPPEFRPIRVRDNGEIVEHPLNNVYRDIIKHNRSVARHIESGDEDACVKVVKRLEDSVTALCGELTRLLRLCASQDMRYARYLLQWALLPVAVDNDIQELLVRQTRCYELAHKYYDAGEYQSAKKYTSQAVSLSLESHVHLGIDVACMKENLMENRTLMRNIYKALDERHDSTHNIA